MISPLIYILDDDPDFSILLATVLKKNNFKVETFEVTKDMVARIGEEKPKLCFVDLNLGTEEGAGFKVIETLKKKFPKSLPMIVLSRRSAREDITQALEVGASDYLTKPLDDVIMLSKVKLILGMGNESKLAFSRVPDSLKKCEVQTIVYLSEVSETGFTILSNHLISKGALVDLGGPSFQEIAGVETLKISVSNTWKEEGSNLFGALLELTDDHKNVKASIRSWIMQYNK